MEIGSEPMNQVGFVATKSRDLVRDLFRDFVRDFLSHHVELVNPTCSESGA